MLQRGIIMCDYFDEFDDDRSRVEEQLPDPFAIFEHEVHEGPAIPCFFCGESITAGQYIVTEIEAYHADCYEEMCLKEE